MMPLEPGSGMQLLHIKQSGRSSKSRIATAATDDDGGEAGRGWGPGKQGVGARQARGEEGRRAAGGGQAGGRGALNWVQCEAPCIMGKALQRQQQALRPGRSTH